MHSTCGWKPCLSGFARPEWLTVRSDASLVPLFMSCIVQRSTHGPPVAALQAAALECSVPARHDPRDGACGKVGRFPTKGTYYLHFSEGGRNGTTLSWCISATNEKRDYDDQCVLASPFTCPVWLRSGDAPPLWHRAIPEPNPDASLALRRSPVVPKNPYIAAASPSQCHGRGPTARGPPPRSPE